MSRKDGLPSSRQITRWMDDLGPVAKNEYIKLRETYKRQGMEPREAIERACKELNVKQRHDDWKERRTLGEALGAGVPLTPMEMQSVIPGYTPAGVVKAEEVGSEDLSLAEQVAWAKRWVARVQNGEPAPTLFPCDGALFWFQSALANRREFEKVVLRVDSPNEGEGAYLRDGQYRLKEIQDQVTEAVRECGPKLVELEAGFAELLKETA